jgi:hypothetical protein
MPTATFGRPPIESNTPSRVLAVRAAGIKGMAFPFPFGSSTALPVKGTRLACLIVGSNCTQQVGTCGDDKGQEQNCLDMLHCDDVCKMWNCKARLCFFVQQA